MANSAQVIQRAVLREQCGHHSLVLHSDNGSAMKGSNIHAKLEELGVSPSHSRARISNDNAYSEALFLTCKYHPAFPATGFTDVRDARRWVGNSCTGTTMCIGIARSVTSRLLSAMRARINPSWRIVIRGIKPLVPKIQHAGQVRHATGSPLAAFGSTLKRKYLSIMIYKP